MPFRGFQGVATRSPMSGMGSSFQPDESVTELPNYSRVSAPADTGVSQAIVQNSGSTGAGVSAGNIAAGAGTGAAAGGPIGAAIGAAVALLQGIFGGMAAKKQQERQRANALEMAATNTQMQAAQNMGQGEQAALQNIVGGFGKALL